MKKYAVLVLVVSVTCDRMFDVEALNRPGGSTDNQGRDAKRDLLFVPRHPDTKGAGAHQGQEFCV